MTNNQLQVTNNHLTNYHMSHETRATSDEINYAKQTQFVGYPNKRKLC